MFPHKTQPVKVQLRLWVPTGLCACYLSGNQSKLRGSASKSYPDAPSLMGRSTLLNKLLSFQYKGDLCKKVGTAPLPGPRRWITFSLNQHSSWELRNLPSSAVPVANRITFLCPQGFQIIHVSIWFVFKRAQHKALP